mgnify:CR=1 FL=1
MKKLPCFNADEFNSRDTGYWILSPEQFERMETKKLILVDMIGVNKTRCTFNLILISDYDFIKFPYIADTNLDPCEWATLDELH